MAIEGIDELNRKLSALPENLLKQAEKILNINARALQRYIRVEKMTGGTTESRLRARSGHLRGSVVVIKAERKEDSIESGISIGKVYARTHIGPVGQKTIIKPKKGKYLTIPFPQEYITKTGRIVKPPAVLSRRTSRKFIAFRKVKQVIIPARIHPEDLLAWIKPKITEDFSSGKFKVV